MTFRQITFVILPSSRRILVQPKFLTFTASLISSLFGYTPPPPRPRAPPPRAAPPRAPPRGPLPGGPIPGGPLPGGPPPLGGAAPRAGGAARG